MLDPARLGVMLRELALGGGDRARGVIEHDRARRRGALIDGEDMAGLGHQELSKGGLAENGLAKGWRDLFYCKILRSLGK
jgi:hypothetical protein